jgi:hypothetical protein
MNAFSRAGLAVVSLLVMSASTLGQNLRLSSIRIIENNVIELSLADPPQQSVHVHASTDFQSWVEVTNGMPDSRGVLSVADADARRGSKVFRLSTDGPVSDRFIATVNADYAGPITNATVTIVASGKTFSTDQNGRVSILVSDLDFETGFRLKVDAPGFESETIDLPPALYSYTFSLTPLPLAPAQIVGRTYRFGDTGSGETNSITLYDSGLFRLQTTNGVFLGAYSAERSTTIADTWSIKAAAPDGYRQLEFTFNSETVGRFTNIVNGVTRSGDFTQGNFIQPTVIQPTTPPPALRTLRLVTLDSALGPGLDFTVTLTGATSGTFWSTGRFQGHGTFTYSTTTATGAKLRLDWLDEFAGDYDDLTLNFLEGAGLAQKANTFSGTIAAEGIVEQVTGTFSYE